MPTPVVAGNWKMNTTLAEATALAAGVREGMKALRGVEVILCPPFISLAAVRDAVRGSSIKVGAQNMHFEKSGAFTGEVSAAMLQGLCDYVILGHSERRQLFGEDDGLINRKVKAAFAHGLRPILCVGETLEQRESGRAAQVVGQQVKAGLAGVHDITGLVVAYEPVWAIGTGRAATPEIAAEVMGGTIAEALRELFGAAAGQVPLLYGGSVNPGNVAGYAGQASIHGALVGGASLQAAQFVEIARATAAAKALS
ncbi:MAG: triose-phosphate isomerase [Dehalococcoidia bacterium]|nr:triose-phosphate isomerase [Dehalococcoidia bacterium]MSQ17054.1 triose-phosphate isomerase [Dehalococcoidia bacterium]